MTGRRPAGKWLIGRAIFQSRAGGSRHRLSDDQDREVLEAIDEGGLRGVILDYDEAGNLVSLEILDASRRVTDARRVEFQTID